MAKKENYVENLIAIEKEFCGVSFANISKDPHLPVYQGSLGCVMFTCFPSSMYQPKDLYYLGGKYDSYTKRFDSVDKFIEAAYKAIQRNYTNFKLYNDYQKKQIVLGIEEGLPIHMFANPKLTEDQMELLREGAKLGYPIKLYHSDEFSFGQMYQIQQGFKENLNVSFYLSSNFSEEQMIEIRGGLKEELDVTWYANPEFDVSQMQCIREGLRLGLDVSWYANPEFDVYQMRCIRGGLKEGLDVRQFAYPECDLGEMAKILNRLMEEKRSIDSMIKEATVVRDGCRKKDVSKEVEMSR